MPRRSHRPGIFDPSVSFDRSVSAYVDEAQAAPGLNILVAISADVESRVAVEQPVTMAVVPAVTMTMVPAVAMAAVAAASRSGGHRGSTEGDRGGDNE
jgi:hypothetical protein